MERYSEIHELAKAIASASDSFGYVEERDPDEGLHWYAKLSATYTDGNDVSTPVFVHVTIKDGRVRYTGEFSFPDREAAAMARSGAQWDESAPERPKATFDMTRPNIVPVVAKALDKALEDIALWTEWLRVRAQGHLDYRTNIQSTRSRLLSIFEPFCARLHQNNETDKVYWDNGGEAQAFSNGECTIKLRCTVDEAEAVAKLLKSLRDSKQEG